MTIGKIPKIQQNKLEILLQFFWCRRGSTIWLQIIKKSFLKYFFHITGFARCENENSVSLIPPIEEYVQLINDSRSIICNGTAIKWKTPNNNYVTNLDGRIHVAENKTLNTLTLVLQNIEEKDLGTWTCEGNYGNKSFSLIVYSKFEFKFIFNYCN
jgi:hypothetical protein